MLLGVTKIFRTVDIPSCQDLIVTWVTWSQVKSKVGKLKTSIAELALCQSSRLTKMGTLQLWLFESFWGYLVQQDGNSPMVQNLVFFHDFHVPLLNCS